MFSVWSAGRLSLLLEVPPMDFFVLDAYKLADDELFVIKLSAEPAAAEGALFLVLSHLMIWFSDSKTKQKLTCSYTLTTTNQINSE